NLFGQTGFDYVTVNEVRDELAARIGKPELSPRSDWRGPVSTGAPASGLLRIGPVPLYAVDPLVRRAQPLQDTADAIVAAIYLSPRTAADQQLAENDRVRVEQDGFTAELPVVIDAGVPDGCVFLPQAVPGSEALGLSYGPVELEKRNA
ncbi:MAG TPA: NADH-quinone oxidoreductase subunit G, partial [Chromatiales bacterium]|nr:NADH-quinone oxidoreductase subunit G [Chromatiales bacterium]